MLGAPTEGDEWGGGYDRGIGRGRDVDARVVVFLHVGGPQAREDHVTDDRNPHDDEERLGVDEPRGPSLCLFPDARGAGYLGALLEQLVPNGRDVACACVCAEDGKAVTWVYVWGWGGGDSEKAGEGWQQENGV